MRIKLNFLHGEDKKAVSSIARMAWMRNILRCLFLILCLFDTALVLLFLLLSDQANTLAQQTRAANQRYSYYNTEVSRINNEISQLSEAGQNYGVLTPRFWSLINAVPPNIQLSLVNLDLAANSINIPGIAKDRDALLAFENILADLPWVEKTYLPKSQLLQKEQINFQIQITVKPPSIDEYLGLLDL